MKSESGKSAYQSLQSAYDYADTFNVKKSAYQSLQEGYRYAESFGNNCAQLNEGAYKRIN